MENDIEIGKLTMKPNKPAEEARPRLGRGLAALLGGAEANPQSAATAPRAPKKVPIEFLRPILAIRASNSAKTYSTS